MRTAISLYAYAPDLARNREFYERGLGVAPDRRRGNWLPFEIAGATFALHGADESGQTVDRFNLTFAVDDVDEAVARFEHAGARVLRGVADEAFGRRAVVADPEGRQIELVQHD